MSEVVLVYIAVTLVSVCPTFTMKLVTAFCNVTLELQHLVCVNLRSQYYAFDTGCENLSVETS